MNRAWRSLAGLLLVGAAQAQGPDGKGEFPNYVGQAVCRECHAPDGPAADCALDPVPEHERAWAALTSRAAQHIAALSSIRFEPQNHRVCLSCHSAGADEGPRWHAPTFRISDGVQCESCHGAGSVHVRQQREGAVDRAPVIRRGDLTNCIGCHRDRPSHREVLEGGFALTDADRRYKTPVHLAVAPDGRRLYVVCEQSDSVVVVDVERGVVAGEITVGRRPHHAAFNADGSRLYVSNRLSNTLSVIDVAAGREVVQVPVGQEPHGVLVDAPHGHVLVANTGQNSVSLIDAQTLREKKRLVMGQGPWSIGLAAGGRHAYVTSVRPDIVPFLDPPRSEVSVIDLTQETVARRIVVPEANMLQGVARVPGRDLMLMTLMRTKSLVPMTRLSQGWTITNGLGLVYADGRVDQVLLDEPGESFPDPMDLAVSPDGRQALVTSGGANLVAVIDIERLIDTVESFPAQERKEIVPDRLDLSENFVIARVTVGANPRGVAFSPNGRHAYVVNALDDSVSVLDTASWEIARNISLGGPESITPLRRGERLFHSAENAFGRQFSCRSCHPDGHLNGLTFDIEADGLGMHPVDNRTLRGIFDTAPYKWEGTNPTLHWQCGPRLAVFFTRRQPFAPDELDDVVRYMSTIELPRNPYRSDDGLTLSQRRGKAVFERERDNDGRWIAHAMRCSTCHNGALFTNQQRTPLRNTMWFDAPVRLERYDLHDIEEFGDLGVFYYLESTTHVNRMDVPHLINIFDGAPYLHNGAAPTLEEIWTRFNVTEDHGRTSDLTREQYNDLIAYLKAL